MNNYRQPGDILTIPAPYAVSSGDIVISGLIIGIAQTDAESGADVAIKTTGVFELSKVSAQAWASVGLAIYVHVATDGARSVTTSSSGNTKIGVSAGIAANPSDEGLVRLNGTF